MLIVNNINNCMEIKIKYDQNKLGETIHWKLDGFREYYVPDQIKPTDLTDEEIDLAIRILKQVIKNFTDAKAKNKLQIENEIINLINDIEEDDNG